ncbi:MAG: 50S ribosomal protein L21 [Spirochaetales bacterium]|nr:50S ribosomal protein L21 [Spirochaetales bacterium]
MYALVEIKGKQYKAEKGSLLKVDRLESKEGDKVEFDSILLLSDKGNVTVGEPYVQGAKISAKVETHGRGKKVIVFKYKKRKDYQKKNGFRSQFTEIRVENISTAVK